MDVPLEVQRTRVILREDHVAHVSSTDFPRQFPEEDLSFNLADFQKNCKIKIISLSPTTIEFDLIGVDASFANALRRILIAEIPTMAIDQVWILNNTSIIQDEVLAHRLGLIPIKADPTEFEFRTEDKLSTDVNTIVMKLNVECPKRSKKSNKKGEEEEEEGSGILNVYSGDIVFVPQGDQEKKYTPSSIRPVDDDILIAKLGPGQAIEAVLHLFKDTGKEHAKWSPVATASYRLLPDVQIIKPIKGDLAHRFVKCFAEGVAEVQVNKDGERVAVVVNNRRCTMSREVLRDPELKDMVILSRVRDHFIFSVESTGIISPKDLVNSAITTLINKCKVAQAALNQL